MHILLLTSEENVEKNQTRFGSRFNYFIYEFWSLRWLGYAKPGRTPTNMPNEINLYPSHKLRTGHLYIWGTDNVGSNERQEIFIEVWYKNNSFTTF